MAGGELLDRVLAKAKKGPAKRPAEETRTPQASANSPGVGAVLGLESTRPPSKKIRVKSNGATGGAVDAGGPNRGELPSWLVRLGEVGRGDPVRLCSEICRVASDKLKQVADDREEREGATARVTELEKELQLARKESQLTKEELQTANGKLYSAEEELKTANGKLQSAEEELKTANGKLQSAEEELKTAHGKLQQVTEENESLEGTVEGLRAELDEALSDASGILEVSFDNAIQQVQLCHPELSIDRRIVNHLHTAVGDQIQDRGPDGIVRVVFKGPTAL